MGRRSEAESESTKTQYNKYWKKWRRWSSKTFESDVRGFIFFVLDPITTHWNTTKTSNWYLREWYWVLSKVTAVAYIDTISKEQRSLSTLLTALGSATNSGVWREGRRVNFKAQKGAFTHDGIYERLLTNNYAWQQTMRKCRTYCSSLYLMWSNKHSSSFATFHYSLHVSWQHVIY